MSGTSTADVWPSLIGHLGDPAIRSLATALLAALVLKLARMKDASTRLAVWRGVLYAALAMPVMAWLMPGLPLPLPRMLAPQAGQPVEAASPPHVVQLSDYTFAPPAHDRAVQAAPAQPAPAPKRREIPWPAVGAATYLLVAGYFLARLGVGWVLSRRLRRSVGKINDPSALAILERQSAGLRRPPGLAESKAVAVPITLGIRKPVILLPATWREWEEPKLRAVLAHEVSHVARNDALTQMLAALHRSIFWFSPLGWWLERRLAELAEQASDDDALRVVSDRTYYAEVLLGFLGAVEAAQGRIQWEGISMAKGTRVERRVDHILSASGGLLRGLSKPVGVGMLLVAMPLVCLVAAVRPEARQKAPDVTAKTGLTIAPTSVELSFGTPPASAMQEAPAPPAAPAAAPAPAPHPPVPAPSAIPRPPRAPAPPTEAFHWANHSDDYQDAEAYAIVSGGSISMSGGPADMRHAKSLRNKIGGDFIWFRRDGKGYVIRDAATVQQAKQFFAPQEALGRQQEELGKKQEELGRQQEVLGKKMEEVRVKVPDLSAELKRVEAQLAQLREGATMEALGNVQSALGELQGRLGALQGQAGAEQGKLAAMQGELGRQQGELGAQQGRLGAEQGRLAREARSKMKTLLDDSLQKGLAQPE